MTDSQDTVRTIGWTDLTVGDVEALRDFYARVVGWRTEPLDMGGYSDFVMKAAGSDMPVTGTCHAPGSNTDLPSQWLVYVTVADADASATACVELGETLVVAPPPADGGRVAVFRDPAGALCALYQSPAAR